MNLFNFYRFAVPDFPFAVESKIECASLNKLVNELLKGIVLNDIHIIIYMLVEMYLIMEFYIMPRNSTQCQVKLAIFKIVQIT